MEKGKKIFFKTIIKIIKKLKHFFNKIFIEMIIEIFLVIPGILLVSSIFKIEYSGKIKEITGEETVILKVISSISNVIFDILKIIINFSNEASLTYWIMSIMIVVIIRYFLLEGMSEYKKEREYKSEFTEEEINEIYEEYMEDAKSLYICGGKLDFLHNRKKQLNIMKKLSIQCTILSHYNKNELTEKDKALYRELIKSGVKLRNVELNDYFYVKGQIKEDKASHLSALFSIKQKNGLYRKIEIDDTKIVKVLRDEMLKIYKNNSQHPYIKYILLDLGGVYLDGKLEDFIENLKTDKIEVDNSKISIDHKLVLDPALNLGKININDYLKDKIKFQNTDEKKNIDEIIIKKWKETWKPNIQMNQLIKTLKNKNFKVYPCSNVDKINSVHYREKGYFNDFSKWTFFSCDLDELKPNKKFFEIIIEKLKEKEDKNLNVDEILYIDDSPRNIEKASEIGMQTINFRSYENLIEELKKLGLIGEEEIPCSDYSLENIEKALKYIDSGLENIGKTSEMGMQTINFRSYKNLIKELKKLDLPKEELQNKK